MNAEHYYQAEIEETTNNRKFSNIV